MALPDENIILISSGHNTDKITLTEPQIPRGNIRDIAHARGNFQDFLTFDVTDPGLLLQGAIDRPD